MSSLKDQLLKAGLTDKQSLKNARKQKQKQGKKPKNERNELSESAKQVEQARIEKANRDKQLNAERQKTAEQKAQLAQIKQLVESSKIDREEGELAYNFTVGGKIKKLYVTTEQQQQLVRNQIAIVTLTDDQFELVPQVVAKKIAQRDANYVVTIEASDQTQDATDQNDPYADYKIPDDLVW